MSFLQTIRYSLLTFQLGQVPHWDPRKVVQLQQRRLRQLVRKAIEKSPFYRDKYQGIDPNHFDLAQLPPVTKGEIREHFDHVVTDPRVRLADVQRYLDDNANLGRWFLNRYAVCHTSGSQGPPLPIVLDRRSVELLFAVNSARANMVAKLNVIDGLRRLRDPARVALVTFRRGFYPSGAALAFMEQIVGPFTRVLRLSATQPDLIEQLNQFQPHSLVAYASVLGALEQQQSRLQLRCLRQIGNTSERLSPVTRKRIEVAFAAPVLDHYGTGECLQLTDGCSHGGIHVNADWGILEVVDDNNQPVSPGEVGAKMLVTNLANTVQPFIRYEVPDRIVMSRTECPCGSRLPLIERIDGRSADVFWVSDGQQSRLIPGILFHSAIDSIGVIREWQAVQCDDRWIKLSVELEHDAGINPDEITRELARRLREQGLPADVRLDVETVAKLAPSTTTGKMQRMVDRRAVQSRLASEIPAG